MELERVDIERPIVITNRGMITIPATLRKRYNLHDGDRIVIIEDEGTLRLIPIVPEELLRVQSCPAGEMVKILRESRAEELELENK